MQGDIRHVGGKNIGKWLNNQGYYIVRLSKPRAMFRVHRLVAEAFVKNNKKLPVVNHINCVRSDNNYLNLEWCTQWGNLNHSQKLGRMQRNYWVGKRSPNAKLTDEQVIEIKKMYSDGNISWETIGSKFGVSKRTIGRIVHNKSYIPLPAAPKEKEV